MTKNSNPPKKAPKGVANRHIFARLSYLYQAANYLSAAGETTANISSVPKPPSQAPVGQAQHELNELDQITPFHGDNKDTVTAPSSSQPFRALPHYYVSHLRGISRKGQSRLSREVKRAVCKRCDILLTPGMTAESRVENQSRGGKKPWADVLVLTCLACGAEKRFPTGANRQMKKKDRTAAMARDAVG